MATRTKTPANGRKAKAEQKIAEIKQPTPRPIDPEEDADEPMLEIEAFKIERPKIVVHLSPEDKDGQTFEIKLIREFGIADQHSLKADGEEFETLWNKKSLTPKERRRLKTLLDRMFNQVFAAPQDVRDLIDDQQRSNIVTAFTYAPYVIAAARERRLAKEAEAEGEEDETETEADELTSET